MCVVMSVEITLHLLVLQFTIFECFDVLAAASPAFENWMVPIDIINVLLTSTLYQLASKNDEQLVLLLNKI